MGGEWMSRGAERQRYCKPRCAGTRANDDLTVGFCMDKR